MSAPASSRTVATPIFPVIAASWMAVAPAWTAGGSFESAPSRMRYSTMSLLPALDAAYSGVLSISHSAGKDMFAPA